MKSIAKGVANQCPVSSDATVLARETRQSADLDERQVGPRAVPPLGHPLFGGSHELARHRLQPSHDRLGEVGSQPGAEREERGELPQRAPARPPLRGLAIA